MITLAYRLWQPELLRETRVLGALFQDTVFSMGVAHRPTKHCNSRRRSCPGHPSYLGLFGRPFFYWRSLACAVPDRQFGSRLLDFVRSNGRTRAATHSAKLSMGRKSGRFRWRMRSYRLPLHFADRRCVDGCSGNKWSPTLGSVI